MPGSTPRWLTRPNTATRPGTNWARRRITTLIETSASSRSQTDTISPRVLLRHRTYGASASRGAPVFFPAFAGAHCAHPRRDGQAELTWAAGYTPRWFTRPQTVTHRGSNLARRSGTALVETMYTTTKPNRHLTLFVIAGG